MDIQNSLKRQEAFQEKFKICRRARCFSDITDLGDVKVEAVRTLKSVSVTAWRSIKNEDAFELYRSTIHDPVPLDEAWKFAEDLSEYISMQFNVPQSVVNYTVEKQTYGIRLSFLWDDSTPDTKTFHITAPPIGKQNLRQILKEEHEALDAEHNGIYDCDGRTPENLIRVVCDKYGWDCGDLEYDVDLELE
jgi:hypothetical protein